MMDGLAIMSLRDLHGLRPELRLQSGRKKTTCSISTLFARLDHFTIHLSQAVYQFVFTVPFPPLLPNSVLNVRASRRGRLNSQRSRPPPCSHCHTGPSKPLQVFHSPFLWGLCERGLHMITSCVWSHPASCEIKSKKKKDMCGILYIRSEADRHGNPSACLS